LGKFADSARRSTLHDFSADNSEETAHEYLAPYDVHCHGGRGILRRRLKKVREATSQYKEVDVAISQGFVRATPCVSGPDHGAKGVHFVLVDRLNNGVLNPTQPEALIYEPMANGALPLAGVEYIVFAHTWQSRHPAGGTAALDGNLMNYLDCLCNRLRRPCRGRGLLRPHGSSDQHRVPRRPHIRYANVVAVGVRGHYPHLDVAEVN
jgi:hypothetical protein